jgi:ABC-2 type transport system ATP-binding protein
MTPMPAAIAVSELTRVYPRFRRPGHVALDRLTLSIAPGTAFGLIGPNGAGKTTFIKLLLGVARPTSGQVQVLGGDPDDAEVRARLGYLPERLHLPVAFDGLSYLRSVATLKRLSPSRDELAALLTRVGLQPDGQRIGGYSKGMRQRLGLAAAMLGRPELLILDEPTDGIDPLGRVEVRALLLEEKQRGATILLNSHLLAETERLCDRVGVLEGGRLKLEGSLDDVRRARSGWRVCFSGVTSPEVLTPLGFVAEGREWRLLGDDAVALNHALEAARRAGALVTELSPLTRDLEQVLAETLS